MGTDRMTSMEAASRLHIPNTIEYFWREHDYAPTVRELGKMIGKSVGYTHAALLRLQAEGIVSWTPNMQRTLRVVDE